MSELDLLIFVYTIDTESFPFLECNVVQLNVSTRDISAYSEAILPFSPDSDKYNTWQSSNCHYNSSLQACNTSMFFYCKWLTQTNRRRRRSLMKIHQDFLVAMEVALLYQSTSNSVTEYWGFFMQCYCNMEMDHPVGKWGHWFLLFVETPSR
jgi:hypothetical protein